MRFSIAGAACFLFAGCTTIPAVEEAPGPPVTQAAQEYRACMFAAADKRMSMPAAADDIVAAAEGDCRPRFLVYVDRLRMQFAASAESRAEKQLGNDKADAYIRQMQLDTRRLVTERISIHSLTATPGTSESGAKK